MDASGAASFFFVGNGRSGRVNVPRFLHPALTSVRKRPFTTPGRAISQRRESCPGWAATAFLPVEVKLGDVSVIVGRDAMFPTNERLLA